MLEGTLHGGDEVRQASWSWPARAPAGAGVSALVLLPARELKHRPARRLEHRRHLEHSRRFPNVRSCRLEHTGAGWSTGAGCNTVPFVRPAPPFCANWFSRADQIARWVDHPFGSTQSRLLEHPPGLRVRRLEPLARGTPALAGGPAPTGTYARHDWIFRAGVPLALAGVSALAGSSSPAGSPSRFRSSIGV